MKTKYFTTRTGSIVFVDDIEELTEQVHEVFGEDSSLMVLNVDNNFKPKKGIWLFCPSNELEELVVLFK